MGVLWKKHNRMAFGKSQEGGIRWITFPESGVLGIVVGYGLLDHLSQWSPEGFCAR
jgi:hypothetical protein